VGNAVVTLENPQTTPALQTTTNQAGQYLFDSVLRELPTGRHKPGFAPIVFPSLTVSSRTEHTRDLIVCTQRHKRIRHRQWGVSGTSVQGYYVNHVDQGFWELHRS